MNPRQFLEHNCSVGKVLRIECLLADYMHFFLNSFQVIQVILELLLNFGIPGILV